MASGMRTAPETSGDGPGLRREEVQPGPILSLPSDSIPRADSVRSSCPPLSANGQTHEPRRSPGSSFSVVSSLQFPSAPGILGTLWKYIWNEGQTRNYREAFVSVIAFVSLLMAGVAFWPANTAASDGYKSRLLAEWSARKEFLSNCEEHNWPSPSCDIAKDIQLEAPPNFDRSDWKRYLIRDWSDLHSQMDNNKITRLDNVSSNTLSMLLWYPVCASLLIGISLLRNKGIIVPHDIHKHLRGLSHLPKRLFIALTTNKRPTLSNRNGLSRSGTSYFEPFNRLNATTSGAAVIQSQGSQLRRRHAAQLKDEINTTRLSSLTESNISSVLGEAKQAAFIEIHDTQVTIPKPSQDLSPYEANLDQLSRENTIEQAYHVAQAEVLETSQLRSYSPSQYIPPRHSPFDLNATTSVCNEQAQARKGDLEIHSPARINSQKSRLKSLVKKRQYRAREPECVAYLDRQDTHSQQQGLPCTILVIRPSLEPTPSRPRRPSYQWSVHFCTGVAFQPLVNGGFESLMPECLEKPLAVYIFHSIGDQLRTVSRPFSSNIEVWSESRAPKVDPSQQFLMYDCVRSASAHLLEHRLNLNVVNTNRQFMTMINSDIFVRAACWLLRCLNRRLDILCRLPGLPEEMPEEGIELFAVQTFGVPLVCAIFTKGPVLNVYFTASGTIKAFIHWLFNCSGLAELDNRMANALLLRAYHQVVPKSVAKVEGIMRQYGRLIWNKNKFFVRIR